MATPAENRPSDKTSWLDDATLSAVRPKVRALLESSPGFQKMPPEQQRELARTMVHVASYMANPDGLAKEELGPNGGVLSRAQDAVEDAKSKASSEIGRFAGKDFQAGAEKQGVQQYKELIGAVDFPSFVGGLIQNVFQAIITASIQQMNAYAELLKSVAQTVDQFAQDNITGNNARDWLIDKYPDTLDLDTSTAGQEGGTPKVTLKGDNTAALKQIGQDLQLAKPLTDLSDEDQEGMLVQAARLQMARSRQQLLASMVILGINRIVVTDGAIKAKVIFSLAASDQAARKAGASLYDSQASRNRNTTSLGFGGWGIGGAFGASSENVNEQQHVTTVRSSVDETSESKAEVNSRLTGEVNVNFKSDYFPMDKLASPGMIAAIQGNSKPVDPNVLPSKQAPSGRAPAAA